MVEFHAVLVSIERINIIRIIVIVILSERVVTSVTDIKTMGQKIKEIITLTFLTPSVFHLPTTYSFSFSIFTRIKFVVVVLFILSKSCFTFYMLLQISCQIQMVLG